MPGVVILMETHHFIPYTGLTALEQKDWKML